MSDTSYTLGYDAGFSGVRPEHHAALLIDRDYSEGYRDGVADSTLTTVPEA